MPEIQLSKEKEEIFYISNASGQFNIWEKKECPVQLAFFENEIIDRLVKDEDYLAFTANIEKKREF